MTHLEQLETEAMKLSEGEKKKLVRRIFEKLEKENYFDVESENVLIEEAKLKWSKIDSGTVISETDEVLVKARQILQRRLFMDCGQRGN